MAIIIVVVAAAVVLLYNNDDDCKCSTAVGEWDLVSYEGYNNEGKYEINTDVTSTEYDLEITKISNGFVYGKYDGTDIVGTYDGNKMLFSDLASPTENYEWIGHINDSKDTMDMTYTERSGNSFNIWFLKYVKAGSSAESDVPAVEFKDSDKVWNERRYIVQDVYGDVDYNTEDLGTIKFTEIKNNVAIMQIVNNDGTYNDVRAVLVPVSDSVILGSVFYIADDGKGRHIDLSLIDEVISMVGLNIGDSPYATISYYTVEDPLDAPTRFLTLLGTSWAGVMYTSGDDPGTDCTLSFGSGEYRMLSGMLDDAHLISCVSVAKDGYMIKMILMSDESIAVLYGDLNKDQTELNLYGTCTSNQSSNNIVIKLTRVAEIMGSWYVAEDTMVDNELVVSGPTEYTATDMIYPLEIEEFKNGMFWGTFDESEVTGTIIDGAINFVGDIQLDGGSYMVKFSGYLYGECILATMITMNNGDSRIIKATYLLKDGDGVKAEWSDIDGMPDSWTSDKTVTYTTLSETPVIEGGKSMELESIHDGNIVIWKYTDPDDVVNRSISVMNKVEDGYYGDALYISEDTLTFDRIDMNGNVATVSSAALTSDGHVKVWTSIFTTDGAKAEVKSVPLDGTTWSGVEMTASLDSSTYKAFFKTIDGVYQDSFVAFCDTIWESSDVEWAIRMYETGDDGKFHILVNVSTATGIFGTYSGTLDPKSEMMNFGGCYYDQGMWNSVSFHLTKET